MLKVRWTRVLLAMIACVVSTGFARGGVLAPGTPVAGVSQAVWGDRWWQWAMSYPEGSNPMTDPTGAFSGLGDQGPVFFLAGTISGPAERVATVREGQILLLPIVMVTAPIGLFGATEPAVRADAAATMGTASNLFLTIDGSPASLPAPAPSLLDYYRTTPPGTFPLTFVDNNIFGVDPGTYNSVAVGYLVMLEGAVRGEPHDPLRGQLLRDADFGL